MMYVQKPNNCIQDKRTSTIVRQQNKVWNETIKNTLCRKKKQRRKKDSALMIKYIAIIVNLWSTHLTAEARFPRQLSAVTALPYWHNRVQFQGRLSLPLLSPQSCRTTITVCLGQGVLLCCCCCQCCPRRRGV